MLEIKNIHKAFDGLGVLKGVSLSVEKGDVVAILGKSGSGKTTLLRCINFLETADDGELVFDGETVPLHNASKRDIARIRKKTAFVFQNYNLFKGIAGSQFVGMANFEFVFKMRDFSIALQNTLLLNFLDLIVGFPVPIILSIMLNEIKSTGIKRVSQTLLYLPHFLSWVIIGGMVLTDRKSTRLNSSHSQQSRMPSSA